MNKFLDGYKTYDPEAEGYGNATHWRHAFRKRMSREEIDNILDEKDPYSILGISWEATMQEIKNAFRKLALKWHPDKNPGNITKATRMFQVINAAYQKLIYYRDRT